MIKRGYIIFSFILMTFVIIGWIYPHFQPKLPPIDLVYLWVDDSDPIWVQKRDEALKQYPQTPIYGKSKNRWRDRGELKYSLRSIDKNLPWIRHIYIVTDHQIPKWLNTSHPKIRIIDHIDILPPNVLPLFNSNAIETALQNIPNLSEHFLYANDDCFVNKPLSPDFFFTSSGKPINYMEPMTKLQFIHMTERYKNESWMKQALNPFRLIKDRFNYDEFIGSNHNIRSLSKSSLIKIHSIFKKELLKTQASKFRQDDDVNPLALNLLYGDMTQQIQTLSNDIQNKTPCLYAGVYIPDANLEPVTRYDVCTFCINDSASNSDADNEKIKKFLESKFPYPSSFEKK